MQSFGATLKYDPHFFVFNHGIIQTILGTCIGMLSSENDDFKIMKTAKNIKRMCITCTIVPRLMELFYLSKPVCR